MQSHRRKVLNTYRWVAFWAGLVLILGGIVAGTWGGSPESGPWSGWYLPLLPWQMGAGVACLVVCAVLSILIAGGCRCVHCGAWADPHIASRDGFMCPRCGKTFEGG